VRFFSDNTATACPEILAANALDLEAGRASGLSSALMTG